MHRPVTARDSAPLVWLTLALAVACAQPPSGDPAGERVENPELGIAIASLPEPFEVAVNEGPTLRLTAPGEAGPGTVEIAVGPESVAGINLVEEVKRRRAIFEEGGEYYGNRELGTPIGTAFTARGIYRTAEGPVEETWIYAIHPAANRLLTLTYRYPGEVDSEERAQQIMALLGEVEAATGSGPPG